MLIHIFYNYQLKIYIIRERYNLNRKMQNFENLLFRISSAGAKTTKNELTT